MASSLGALELRTALLAALDALRESRAGIDALNVYPVPDGDTGTNLVLTFESVAGAVAHAGDRAVDVAHAIRSGALMGARGNSGVICSQVLQTFADLVEAGPAPVEDVARAFKRAVEAAYAAVLHPAEGTILSVLRAASDAAQGDHDDVAAQFAAAARAANDAVRRTPEQMDLLARAGVVDAGGAGLAAVLAAMATALGAPVAMDVPLLPPAAGPPSACGEPITFAYEVMYTLHAPDERIPALRALLGTIGDSVAVTGGRGTWRVHVHTDDHERAVSMGTATGRVDDVGVVSFTEQIEAGQRGVALSRTERPASLVAVVDGEGSARLLRDLGAVTVASPRELRIAITDAPREHVIVLPNDPASRAAALEAAHASHKTVIVMPVADAAAALGIAAQYGEARPAEDCVADMNEAFARIRSAGAGRDEVLDVVGRLAAPGSELATIVCARDVTEDERERVRGSVASAFPSLAVEVHEGGHGTPPFLVAVE